ncbi:MAG: VCBS repeat-containing protein [Thermoguttaceae bacterium]|jgi:hypothetical protein|nr:VCBS repeat-containing protein [Thermoguttaceae bacterium]
MKHVWFLFLLAAIGTGSGRAEQAVNLVPNGDLEGKVRADGMPEGWRLSLAKDDHRAAVGLSTQLLSGQYSFCVENATARRGTMLASSRLEEGNRPVGFAPDAANPISLTSDVAPASSSPPPVPPLVPPVYATLKDLHVETDLVRDGQAVTPIVAPERYAAQAAQIAAAVERITGACLAIVADNDDMTAIPADGERLAGSFIVLGNRSTNAMIEELYNRFHTLLDLRYPGPGGHEVRTLHNPFGGGHNIVFIGGSDDAGVAAAADAFIAKLAEAGGRQGTLTIGWMREIELGAGVEFPHEPEKIFHWDASAGYRSIGYFGWNSISKHMAAYYMTGDQHHAREFLRLAFPDEQAKRDITRVDGERIENKDDPLAGPYHYNAHMMILFWDLIEEDPFFSDEDRLRITNAFARHLLHEWHEGRPPYALQSPAAMVGSRHGQWSAMAIYCLSRYFARDYGDPVWQQGLLGAHMAFASLERHAWVGGESDNLFWYNTGHAPILRYMLKKGWRGPIEGGVLDELLRGQEILATGNSGDWDLNSASITFLHRAAYLTQDGRWLEYLRRTGIDTAVPRVGQSFWPEDHLQPELPVDMTGRWSIHPMPGPMWERRGTGFPLEESFQFGSFRSSPDETGDFILIDGYNGASRNPYHCFAILELRLGGNTLLKGYRNQLLTRLDGMVEPRVAMDGALRDRHVVGGVAACVGEVPDAAYCNWRRTLAQRVGRYALVVDQLTMRESSENFQVQTQWEVPRGTWDEAGGTIVAGRRPGAAGQPWHEIVPSDPVRALRQGRVFTLEWTGAAQEGRTLTFFSVLGSSGPGDAKRLACLRAGDNVASLRLPQPAVVVAGHYAGTEAELAVIADDHLYARRAIQVAAGDVLLSAGAPVAVDWDFAAGTVSVLAEDACTLSLRAAPAADLALNGQTANVRTAEGMLLIDIPAGAYTITGARPAEATVESLRTWLNARHAEAEAIRADVAPADSPAMLPDVPELAKVTLADVEQPIEHAILVPDGHGGRLIATAGGKHVHLLRLDGSRHAAIETDGPIRVLHWWDDHELLIAGCTDEKVIAFNRDGGRRWVFTSEMDPAVFRAAKDYWFKSAYPGIYGLHSGDFTGGESRLFVGSACTLEILDYHGQLRERLPVFWGNGWKFQLKDREDGSRDLLIARWRNGTDMLSIVNSETLDVRRGFYGVPSGHTMVGGWTAQNRTAIELADVNGDGSQELVSVTNGVWNRVTVFSGGGSPLVNAQFGPGSSIEPYSTMRDLVVADLTSNGTMEIVAATSDALVVCFDHRLEKRWACAMPAGPTVMMAVPAGQERGVLVGCENGAVVLLDGSGRILRATTVEAPPVRRGMSLLTGEEGHVVVMGLASGIVVGLALP